MSTVTVRPHTLDHLQTRDVAQLVQARAWPSVTVLLDTTPADVMQPGDARRLAALVREAEQELAEIGGAAAVADRLRAAAADATRWPTSRGLVLLVSRVVQRSFRLPGAVSPRTVVEHTFATRDLVQTLHRTPPHLLLLVTALCAQLYRGYADTLTPVHEAGFPVQRSLPVLGGLSVDDDRLDDFVARVDAELGRARRNHPAPLLVAGASTPVAALVRRGRNLERLAGVLTGPVLDTAGGLYAAARPSLEEYLRSREEEALLAAESTRARDPHRVLDGIEACWAAAQAGQPQLLVVEEGYRCPAVVDGGTLRRVDWRSARVPEAGDVRHDLVDDLVEVVIDRGGWVAFAGNGTLAESERVTLVLGPGAAPRRDLRG